MRLTSRQHPLIMTPILSFWVILSQLFDSTNSFSINPSTHVTNRFVRPTNVFSSKQHYYLPSNGRLMKLQVISSPMSSLNDEDMKERFDDDNNNNDNDNSNLNDELDRILSNRNYIPLSSNNMTSTSTTMTTNGISPLRQAINFIQEHSNEIQINKSNWDNIFTAIEDMTAEISILTNDSSNTINGKESTTAIVEFPIQTMIRQDMTDMYQLLATLPLSSSISTTTTSSLNHHQQQNGQVETVEPTLRLFGAASTTEPPAVFIHPNLVQHNQQNHHNIISPQLFEQILNVPMSSLTPSSSNTLLYVGAFVAIFEGILSLYTGINFNVIVGITLLFLLLDRIVLNGISIETIFKVVSPELQQRIYHHEAGHFVCAYLLGCPIESIVVSAFAALQDPRFRNRPSFTAGTSFFDPILSEQMKSSIRPGNSISSGGGVTRSSIDRYSIIVMAGIAAEADKYGQADGGASDEYSLIAFLSQLRSNSKPTNNIGTWNSEQIRNQARYGALQAMLLLRQYKPAYDAVVNALEYGGTLKDCIYAIEQAGRQYNLPTRNNRQPMGYITQLNDGISTWTPNNHNNTFINNLLQSMK